MTQSERENPAGFLSSVTESFRSHVDERLKSPFGGAFIVAWFALNWEAVLLLAFSASPIETRIETVKTIHSGWDVLVWKPILFSIAVAMAFYALSALMAVVVEIYKLARSKIEMGFDPIRWVSPTTYVGLKQKHLEEKKFLQEMASDNLQKLNSAESQFTQAKQEAIDLQAELAKYKNLENQFITEKQVLLNRIQDIEKNLRQVDRHLNEVMADRLRYREKLRTAYETYRSVRDGLYMRTNAGTHPDIWNQFLVVGSKLESVYQDISQDAATND